ncbi:hypothetical protein KIN20_027928 [Parelaphostrongylus tenuis]|uniref:GIY-YIG domain-containing protein n=1 Tax=Parelaphostrongylus tenuis TaxID=148309 RepID=A0AAD5R0P1_PARTN|nr:hypothetical protein KIN20_027928 [Parelaphostrongylus tenuis]
MSVDAIYLISCKTSGGEYIGETGRPLHNLIKEHLDGKTNKDPSKPLGTHCIQRHNDDDFRLVFNTEDSRIASGPTIRSQFNGL